LWLVAQVAVVAQEATLSFTPDDPFVGQPFLVTIDVRVTPGVELEQLEISGLPDSTRATFDNLRRTSRQQRREQAGNYDTIRYSADARGLQPFAGPFRCTIRAMAVERVTAAFFSHTKSYPVTIRTSVANLAVRQLPAAGRPADFGGAIGTFTLTGKAIPQIVAPNDIVTLTYTLEGRGWLDNSTLTPPELDANFKCYPPQITGLEVTPPRITMTQTVIPLNTNATTIATPVFNFFDPARAIYRTATMMPLLLTFGATVVSNEPTIRRIDTTPAQLPGVNGEARLGELALAETVTKFRSLIPLAIALIVAVMVVSASTRRQRRYTIPLALLIMIVGVVLSQIRGRSVAAQLLTVGDSVGARVAPATGALELFSLHPDDTILPLEHTTGWLRVRNGNREGWIPATAINSGGHGQKRCGAR